MADEYKLKIVRVRDTPLLNPMGGIIRQKSVDWTVDGVNMHTTVVPSDGFTAAGALALIQPQANEVINLMKTP